MHFKLTVLAITFALATCGPADPGPDAGTPRKDGGTAVLPSDAGTDDAGNADAGQDAGNPGGADGGTPDAGDPYTFEVICRTGYGYNFLAHYHLDAGECAAGLLYAQWEDGGIRPLVSGSQVGGPHGSVMDDSQGGDTFPWYSITYDVGACTSPTGGYPDPPMPNPWRTKTVLGASIVCQ